NLTLPGLPDDDREHKREKRSRQRAKRKIDDLSRAAIPDRSCTTCTQWAPVDDEWGECRSAWVTKERVTSEVWPSRGIEAGMIVARWPNPTGTGIACEDRTLQIARAYGRAVPLRTHRSFAA